MAKDENKESEIRGDEQEIVEQRLPVWRPQDADREYYRYETKKRIQHYTVPSQTIFRPAKPTPTIRDAEHKRVAVYARVSTKSKEQVSSIENQTKYYAEKIAKTPNWDLAEIYSDEGKSGTSKKWRPEFKRMLEDASKKKMDLIVCASVSRFARNISDLIEEGRKLRTTNPSNPVGVYFETEDLYTLDPNINKGARCCISIGKGVIKALGKPSHVSIKISDSHDSLSVFPCDEDDVMAFRVPLKLFTNHRCVMRINSKQFVHGIMRTNQMDTSKTYVLSGEFLEEKNTAVFSLVEGVSLRTQKGVAQP